MFEGVNCAHALESHSFLLVVMRRGKEAVNNIERKERFLLLLQHTQE